MYWTVYTRVDQIYFFSLILKRLPQLVPQIYVHPSVTLVVYTLFHLVYDVCFCVYFVWYSVLAYKITQKIRELMTPDNFTMNSQQLMDLIGICKNFGIFILFPIFVCFVSKKYVSTVQNLFYCVVIHFDVNCYQTKIATFYTF